MKIENQIEILLQLDAQLRQEQTRSADTLANTLKISRAYLFRIMEYLRQYGIEIFWSASENTYKYRHPENVLIQPPIVLKNATTSISDESNFD